MNSSSPASSVESGDAKVDAAGVDWQPREKFRRTDSRSTRRLVYLTMMMLVLGVVIWLAYAASKSMRRSDPPRPAPAASAAPVPTFRIEATPKAVPLREAPSGDAKYVQLMAMLQERFAAYDKLLAGRPVATAAPPRPLESVIYNTGAQAHTGVAGATQQQFPLEAARGGLEATASGAMAAAPATAALRRGLIPGSEAVAAGDSDGVGDLLKPSVLQAEKAAKMPNRNFLLAKGSPLECVLETAIDTSLPGLVNCILSRDVYSDNARVLLLEKGSKLTGEYRGSMRNGQRRLFLIWSRAVTPQGVAIRLNSPGTDTLGRAGVDGFLENRYFERFGMALLVSIIADSLPVIVEAGVSKAAEGQSIDMQMTGSTGQQMGSEILRQNALVPPLLRKNQGDLISVMVARDLDFSSIYSLRLK